MAYSDAGQGKRSGTMPGTSGARPGARKKRVITAAQCAAPIGQFLYGVAFEGFRGTEYLLFALAAGATLLIALLARTTLRNEG